MLFPLTLPRTCLLFLAYLVFIEARAQLDQSFKPVPAYDGKDLWFIESLRQQVKEKLYKERAYEFYLRTSRLDLDDYNNDTALAK